jgi:stress response protein YsnF
VRAALTDAGAVDIDERLSQWKTAGYNGYDTGAAPHTADDIAADRKAFPVVREGLAVGKREISTGGVRVYLRVTQTPGSESVTLREEHATIERRAVDRPATEADLILRRAPVAQEAVIVQSWPLTTAGKRTACARGSGHRAAAF